MNQYEYSVQSLLDDCWRQMLSDPAGARKLAERAQQYADPDSDEACSAQVYAALCDNYLGEHESAVAVLNAALSLALSRNYSRNLLRINNALGMSYQALGRYSAAYDHLEYAKELAQQLDDIPALTPPMLNLASLLLDMGHLESAEHELNEILGLDLSQVPEDNLIEASILQAQILLTSAHYDQAGVILQQTEARARAVDFQYAILRCQIIRGRMLRLRGDLNASIQLLSQVLEAPLMEAEGQETIVCYIELVKALFSIGETEQAVDILTGCIERLKLDKFSTLRLKVLEQLAFGYQLLGDDQREAASLREMRVIEQSAQVQDSLQTVQLREFKRKQEQDRQEQRLRERENVLLKKNYGRLQMLNDVAHQITVTLNFTELGRRLYHILHEYMDVHFVSLTILHESEEALTYRFIFDEGKPITAPDIPFSKDGSNSIAALRSQKPVIVHDMQTLDQRNRVGSGSLDPRSMLFVPLILKDQVLGVFSMQAALPYRFQNEELDMMVAISKFIAIAASNILSHERVQQLNQILTHEKQAILVAHERIEHMAYHDALTSLPNRQALNEVIEQRISGDARSFYLVYIDLDGFKPVNDQYGHRDGDRVLVDTSVRLKDTLRAGDFAARIGGDEFVLLVDAFPQEADLQSFLNRLLAVIEQPIEIDASQINVSASIGAARYPVNGRSLDELMHSADQAMYHIKRSGKGGVMAL